MSTKNFLRIGVFYDGTFFTKAQNYFWGQKYGWLSFHEFHKLLENFIRTKEQGHISYKVVYSAWFITRSFFRNTYYYYKFTFENTDNINSGMSV